MPLIDEQGRVFGRINLIDALVALVLLGVIPLAYGAFLLFRVPKPVITSVTPSQVVEFQASSVQIAGEDLRPFLLAKIGTIASDFLVLSAKHAEIRIPSTLAAGTYDISLADQGQLLTVKPGALTVIPASAVRLDVQALGAFVGVNQADAGLIKVKSTFQSAAAAAPIAEVVAIRPAESGTSRVKLGANVFAKGTLPELRVPAIVRLHCTVINGECRVADTVAAQNATITLPWEAPPSEGQPARAKPSQIKFAIDQVFPAGMRVQFPAMATLRVQFVAAPEIFNVIKQGDVDVSGMVTDTDGAVLEDVGSQRQTIMVNANSEALLRRGFQVSQPMVTFTGTLRVPVMFTPLGWSYHDQLVKVGAVFNFETASGAMTGSILDVKIDQEKAQAGR
jgi:uncharacterized protein DUF4330